MTQIAAYVGVALAGAAYLPQIWHLVIVRCAGGVSRLAFSLWLAASMLVTTHAVATHATIFIILGAVQILATALILICATMYSSRDCGGHGTGHGQRRLVAAEQRFSRDAA